MYDSVLITFLSFPFWSTLALAIALIHWFPKDRSIWKLILSAATILAALGYNDIATITLGGTPFLGKAYVWAFFPLVTVIPIVVISSLKNLKSLDKPFSGMVIALVASVIIMISQIDVNIVMTITTLSILGISIPLTAYIFFKRKNLSDALFLLSLIIFFFEGVTYRIFFAIEIITILGVIGMLCLGATFAVSKDRNLSASVFSQFKLRKELEQTKEELRITQEKLLRAERLTAIGDLAGMIGHDLRNPLQGIAGAAYYLKTQKITPLDGIPREMIENIEKCISYSNKIVNDLIEYSKEIRIEPTQTNPKAIVEDSLRQIRVPAKVQVNNQSETTPTLQMDKEKIEGVFKNIIQNALDAMPNGGTLTIKNKTTNKEVIFEFADTGTGMTPETLSKIWTPLFTTKAKGMGFGLSICKRLVEAHSGTITVKSVPDQGSIFTVTFPLIVTPNKSEQSRYLSNPELTKIIDNMINEAKKKNSILQPDEI